MQHSVPVNGFFRIIMSEDLNNGAMVESETLVRQNCFLIEDD